MSVNERYLVSWVSQSESISGNMQKRAASSFHYLPSYRQPFFQHSPSSLSSSFSSSSYPVCFLASLFFCFFFLFLHYLYSLESFLFCPFFLRQLLLTVSSHLPPLLDKLVINQHIVQSLGSPDLVPAELGVEHLGKQHGAVGVLLGEPDLGVPPAALPGHTNGLV